MATTHGQSSTQLTPQRRRKLIAIAALLLLSIAVTSAITQVTILRRLRTSVGDRLQSMLRVEITSLQEWANTRRRAVEALTFDHELHDLLRTQIRDASEQGYDRAAMIRTPAQATIRDILGPRMRALNYAGFVFFSLDGNAVAADVDTLVGMKVTPDWAHVFQAVAAGDTLVSPPMVLDASSAAVGPSQGRPVIFVVAPVRDDDGKVFSVLSMMQWPEEDFSRIFTDIPIGKGGETFAFDEEGMLLSRSRFDDELIDLGLLEAGKPSGSVLNVKLKAYPGSELTRMAKSAISGQAGQDLQGYINHRGKRVVGAWTWLPERHLGVAAELPYEEAFALVHNVRAGFFALFLLMGLLAAGVVFTAYRSARAARRAEKAEQRMRQLGQYALTEKLGEGGMGEVYLACHALMRRPTAVKLLRSDRAGETAIQRFEREVQLSCQLTHPNTISIYDYGHTPDGTFYYAMEYLPGVDLHDLVSQYGPQPPSRVIHILRQVCGSLAEAHDVGLVHRDIKPSNIMLCQRGGLSDVVKVLDFGLVKAAREDDPGLTAADAVAGTPHFMPPESLSSPESVDGRSDLYALGAVGYWLLTAEQVFVGKTTVQVCAAHLNETPTPPSERLGSALPSDLEGIILRCLAKKQGQRYDGARQLAEALAQCADAGGWNEAEATQWWSTASEDSGAQARVDPSREETRSMVIELGDRRAPA